MCVHLIIYIHNFLIIAPDKPTGLREITEQTTTTSVNIEWDESPPTTCDGVTWYELSYTMDKTCTCSVTNITTNNTHYNLTELVEDATYYITLVAVNAVGKSNFVEVAVYALDDHKSEQDNPALYILFI